MVGWCLRSGGGGIGDDSGGNRQGGRSTARPFRDVAVLRLPHGRLLRSLAADGSPHLSTSTHLLGELVRARGRRQVSLAWLRREHARAEVGDRSLPWTDGCD